MLRDRLNERLKAAMKDKDQCAVATVRLILTAVKDRDIASRTKGGAAEIDETEILSVLQTMIKQRQEAIKLYEQGGRLELAQQEADEIEVIREFLPEQLGAEEAAAAIDDVIAEVGAQSIKDMGKAMGALRARYAGRMDFGQASAVLKEKLNAL